MDFKVINHACVTVLIHKDEKISVEAAGELVRSALEACGYEPWRETRIELFEGARGALLVAVPEKRVDGVSLAPWFEPFIKEYFTD